MISSIVQAEILSKQFSIPKEEILLIGLNLCGINYKNRSDIKRGRFEMRPIGLDKSFFFAMTITPDSPYRHDGKSIFLGDNIIGSASEVIADTCTDTYHRNHRKHLTVNSNTRSMCQGCEFCGAYKLGSEESSLLTKEAMRKSAYEMISRCGLALESIGLVTACFPSEKELVEHLLILRKTYEEFGFAGEIQYIGSQLLNLKSLDILSDSGKFALYFSVEVFDQRETLMRPEKARITLEDSRHILEEAARRGIETSMLYILGLDSLEVIGREFPKYLNILTRHPLVQLMQNYLPKHEILKDKEARSLNYYLKARKFLESIFGPRKIFPLGWDNYRAPWFGWYNGRRLI